jgi:hypothetical protein
MTETTEELVEKIHERMDAIEEKILDRLDELIGDQVQIAHDVELLAEQIALTQRVLQDTSHVDLSQAFAQLTKD